MYFQFDQFTFWITLILIAAVMGVIQGTCAYLILAERKISAWAQDRIGPNRVGPFGLLQPIADGIKFLLKEQVVPANVDKLFYFLGPAIAVSTALLAIAVVPFGKTTPAPKLLDYRPLMQALKGTGDAEIANQGGRDVIITKQTLSELVRPVWPQTHKEEAEILAADKEFAAMMDVKSYPKQMEEYNETVQFVITPHVDIGIVFVFAIGSLAAYAIVLGGWSSNNKYSLLGSLRSSAQLISYEIPMGMSVLGVMIVTGSLNIERMIEHQAVVGWNIVFQPLACLLFVTSVFAECNRVPFDLSEAEQELVGGYHTEYSGMKFALYFLGEYTHMITTSFLVVALFFGGWLLPGVVSPGGVGVLDMILKLLIFAGKMGLFIVFYMFIRWTIPRFRFDQLMGLAWKVMMPLALVNMVAVLLVKHFQPLGAQSDWLLLPASLIILVAGALVSLQMPRTPPRSPYVVRSHPSAMLHAEDGAMR